MSISPPVTDPLQTIQRYRELRASGAPLPAMPVPSWVRNPKRTSLEMVRLPNLLRLENPDTPFAKPVVYVIAGLAALLAFQEATITRLSFPDGIVETPTRFSGWTTALIAGLGAAFFLGLNWMDIGRAGYMTPEAATLAHHPGDTLLLMLPIRGKSTSYLTAMLQYQERWQVQTSDSEHWNGRVLRSLPVEFTSSGQTLLTAHVPLPDDLPVSYHAEHYRLDWMLTIEHQPWWGPKRTDRYLIWIGPRAEADRAPGADR